MTYWHAQYMKNGIWVEYRVEILTLYRLFLTQYGYMKQFVDVPTATPTYLYEHYIAAIGSLKA
jgi:hypothetical protein